MKKFLLFSLLVVAIAVRGQEIPTANNFSEISGNYRADLGSGNFVYSAPLFDMETVNPDFNLRGSMYYNAQAASTIYTAEGILARGWSADFLPSIYRNGSSLLLDEAFFKPNTADVEDDYQPYTRPERVNDLFEFNVFGLSGSFRLVYNSNNTITANLVDSNEYVEIIPGATMTSGSGDGKNITLNGFTVKDDSGTSYIFNEVEESARLQNINQNSDYFPIAHLAVGNPDGYNLYKKAFLLTAVTDKYGRDIVKFSYKTFPWSMSKGSQTIQYNQKVIDKIMIPYKGSVVFSTNLSKITGIAIKNTADQLINNITLSKAGFAFYNKDIVLEKRYQFQYNPLTNTSADVVNNYGNYLKADGKCIEENVAFSKSAQRYEAGLLKTVILPQKAKIDVEYELNTFFTGSNLRTDDNFTYVQVPVTYNPANYTYSFAYGDITPYSSEAYYVKFNSRLYTDPLLTDEDGYPITGYPGLRIYSTGTPQTVLQGFAFEDQCTYGEKVVHTSGYINKTVALSTNFLHTSYISNVKVYKKTLKPENERVSYQYGPSVRVKKTTATDHTGTVLSEKTYDYTDPQDSRRSSGITADFLWYTYAHRNLSSYKPYPIFYRYTSISEPGKGKTVYELNSDQFVSSEFSIGNIAYQPKNIWKYNDAGQLVEHQNNTFLTYKSSADQKARSKIKQISSVIKTYEGTAFKTTTTEKVFDTISMLPVSTQIIEAGVGQTFNEQYTHQKLGNAFYRTAVQKTKNSSALNKSTYTYQKQGTTQAYNLKTVSVAKENLPLEVNKEITRYDDYGNVLEYKTKDGMVVSQLWGYNDSKLVAELKNVPYADIVSNAEATLTAIKSHSAAATYNESSLLTALASLRTTFPDGFVTTYTYKPLVGITSITDANGRKETYQYDDFNRLYRVLNHEGLVIKEYTYNIKN